MFATFRNTAIAALGLCAGLVVPAQAAYVVTLQQVGANVVATGSGTIDLAGLTFVGLGLDGGSMVPGHGVILGSPDDLFKTVGVDGPTASSARIGAVSNQDRSRP
jgi:hypothetical protein